ncbi:hypothetical protein AMTRI_Chr11g152200 [Amborella trichopoda]
MNDFVQSVQIEKPLISASCYHEPNLVLPFEFTYITIIYQLHQPLKELNSVMDPPLSGTLYTRRHKHNVPIFLKHKEMFAPSSSCKSVQYIILLCHLLHAHPFELDLFPH